MRMFPSELSVGYLYIMFSAQCKDGAWESEGVQGCGLGRLGGEGELRKGDISGGDMGNVGRGCADGMLWTWSRGGGR